MVELRGIEPHGSLDSDSAIVGQNLAKDEQKQALTPSSFQSKRQKLASSVQSHNRSLHVKRVPGEYQIPDDLEEIINAWDALPDAIRSGISAMVRVAQQHQ